VRSTQSGDEAAAAPTARSRSESAPRDPLTCSGSSSDDPGLRYDWIDGAPHAIAITRGPSHVLRKVNPAFCRLIGMEEEAVLGRPYVEVLPEPDGHGPLPVLERVFRSGAAESDVEVPRHRAAGEHAVWSCTVWPLRNGSGETHGLVVEVRDRTHEAESTRRLQEMADEIRGINERLLRSALQEQEWAEKAEAAAKAKSDFLSMMSHELRTPLSGIVSYAEILLGEMLGPINERQRNGLRGITSCSAHLVQMIDDVLDYARVEAQSVQVRPEGADVCRLAQEVVAMIEPLAAEKGLRFLPAIPDRPLPLETDSQKVRQILLNLLGNAVKFTDRGEVRLEVHEEKAGVCLCVRDTGTGIPPEDMERIFEPFVQRESVMTRRYGGTGLGLPISRSLAYLLGGELTARSTPGRGSEFVLRLPWMLPAAP
jgi:PAS domain S-box-containing protein